MGESLLGFDLAGLLVEGLDVLEEEPLGGFGERVETDACTCLSLCALGLSSVLSAAVPPPF